MNSQLKKLATEIANNNINLELKINKNTFYIGESFVADYYLIVNKNIQLQDIKPLQSPKFYTLQAKEIDFGTLKFTDTIIDNLPFNKALLHRYILKPQSIGQATVDAMEFQFATRIPLAKNSEYLTQYPDGYFDLQFVSTSNKENIKVLDLPANPHNKKCAFIGDFEIESKLSQMTAKKNEHLLMKIEILGNGNLDVTYVPNINKDFGLKTNIYKTLDSFIIDRGDIFSWKNYEVDLFSASANDYIIKPVEILCFSPTTKKYYTLSTKSTPVLFIDENEQLKTVEEDAPLFLLISIIIGFISLISVIIFFYKKNIGKSTDKKYSKSYSSKTDTNNQESDILYQYLDKAMAKLNGTTDDFLKAIIAGIDKFIEDKFQINNKNNSNEEIYNLLIEKGVSDSMAQNYLIVQSKIEEMRFSPKQAYVDKEELLYFIEQFLLRL